jgi:hypothetical protein
MAALEKSFEAIKPPRERYPDCDGDCGDRGIYCCGGGWDKRPSDEIDHAPEEGTDGYRT